MQAEAANVTKFLRDGAPMCYTFGKEENPMQYKCRITVLRKECYEDLQAEYLADPKSGPCPMFEVGQEFILERNADTSMRRFRAVRSCAAGRTTRR